MHQATFMLVAGIAGILIAFALDTSRVNLLASMAIGISLGKLVHYLIERNRQTNEQENNDA